MQMCQVPVGGRWQRLRLPGEGGCNPIGSPKNGGEFLSDYGSTGCHDPTLDRPAAMDFPGTSPRNRLNVRFSATVHVPGQLDYTLLRRDDGGRRSASISDAQRPLRALGVLRAEAPVF